MSAYLVVDLEIKDGPALEKYVAEVPAMIARYGGRYLVRGGKFELLEGDRKPKRLVVLEFPTMAALKRWYESEEYRPYLEVRRKAADSNAFAVEGV